MHRATRFIAPLTAALLTAAAFASFVPGPAAAAAADATFLYVSANRVMSFDTAAGSGASLDYIVDGVPGQPSRALSGGAVSWTVQPTTVPMRTYVGETVTVPGSSTAHTLVADLTSFARLSPDGRTLLYIVEEPDPVAGTVNNLKVYDVATETSSLLVPLADAADWSPGGDKVAYVSYPAARFDPQGVMLYVYDGGSGGSTKVPTARLVDPGEVNIYSPRWSPSGDKIAFLRLDYDAGTASVVVTDPLGATEDVLLTAPLGTIGFGMEWVRSSGGSQSLFVERLVHGDAPFYLQELPTGGVAADTGSVLHGAFSWQARPEFGDIGPGGAFYREVRDLATLRIAGGFDDGTFRPGEPVKRAQYAKMITIALGLHDAAWTGWGAPSFSDVPQPPTQDDDLRYAFDYVEEAAEAGLIKGDNAGRFNPWNSVTRVQLALMIARAGATTLEPPVPADYAVFSDTAGLSVEARDAIAVAYHNGIIRGKTATTFAPYADATRGQVSAMTWRLMEQLGLL